MRRRDDTGLRATALAHGAGPDAAEAPAWALVHLLNPRLMLAEIPGVALSDEPVDVAVARIDPTPDFAALFPAPPEDGEDPEAWWLTPRTAALLHHELRTLAEDAVEDIEELVDTPIGDSDGGYVFDRLPTITWARDAAWRRRFARCCDDLADDLERGAWPVPRCTGEQMALHLALQDAADTLEREPDLVAELGDTLPEHDADFDLDAALDLLFQDHDLLLLFDPAADGIEEPDNEINRHHGIGDLRPQTWFEPYNNATPRDDRGYRH